MFHTLLLDLNSFFAACEQQARPALRGLPVAVVPVLAETTCAIAASYAAKAFGVKTGTKIWEARQLCPDLRIVQARPKLYVEYHHAIIKAVERCIPVETILSIDEMTCRLDRTQQTAEAASAVALAIKESIRREVGACLTSSIGIASNALLAKLASDMQKPDGLVLLGPHNLPEAILHLELFDIPGIGRNMAERLHRHGIPNIAALWAADAMRLRRVWNGVSGVRFHELLHGADLARQANPKRSIGHQHVLAPAERDMARATPVIRQLLIRAALRLRTENVFCRRLALDIKWTGDRGSYQRECTLPETQDTTLLLGLLARLWAAAPRGRPLRIGVVLSGLVPAARHQPDLFAQPKPASLTAAIDRLNERFGRGAVQYGTNLPALTSKIAFQRVPGLSEF